MGLRERLQKLEAEIPAPECQGCIKPQIVLYDEAYSQNCPDCGQPWCVLRVQSEESRELTKWLIAGERTS